VDELWQVPHFEKMLYDNPQLALTYLDAYRSLGSHLHSIQHSSTASTSSPAAVSSSGVGGSGGGGLTDLLGRSQAYTPGSQTAGGSQQLTGHGQDVVGDLEQRQQQYGLVIRGVLDYLRRDMTHPEGGLFSAEVGLGCCCDCARVRDEHLFYWPSPLQS
jgi:hypothetical protein